MKNQQKSIISLLLSIIISYFSLNAQGLIPYRSGEFWGYATPDKEIVIPPQYDHFDWFYKGLATVAKGCYDCYDAYDGRWGVINEKGEEVIPLKYEFVYLMPDGRIFVLDEGDWFQLSEAGKIIRQLDESPKYSDADRELFSEATPKEYKKNYFSTWYSDNEFCGYSRDGVEFWDDPETVIFFPITQINEENNPPRVVIDFNYEPEMAKLWKERTNKLPASLVVVKRGEEGLELEKFIPLTNEKKENEWTIMYDVPNYSEIERYLSEDSDTKITFAISVKLPAEEIKQNLLFNLISRNIRITDTENGFDIVYFYNSLRELMNPEFYESTLQRMVEDVNAIGQIMNEMIDDQNVLVAGEENPYSGRMLFDVMEKATTEDLERFLEYVSARPFIYIGGTWKIAEIFATWVAGGAPHVH